jgi:hypothetical protein
MNWLLLIILLLACALMMVLEWRGVPTTLQLSFKGDVKRETAFLAQWGQSMATPLAALVVWQLDPTRRRDAVFLIIGVLIASVACFVLKRLLGRVRPNRENAGKFLGPSLKHANYRESFPSSHSACAIALSTFLAYLYPPRSDHVYRPGNHHRHPAIYSGCPLPQRRPRWRRHRLRLGDLRPPLRRPDLISHLFV